MRIDELFDPGLLVQELDDGYVSVRVHPKDASLRIYNYTDKAQIERHWNDVTMHTRGLIVRDGEVVARGWKKFFNASEHDDLDWDERVGWVLTDKIDGSLGILYYGPDGWAVSSRGSFDSPQAVEASAMLMDSAYDALVSEAINGLHNGYSTVVEIIYPENRIVLDYGTERKLVSLGTVFLDGSTRTRAMTTSGAFVNSLRGALELLHRENAEGWVAHRTPDGLMVKLKQEDYLLKHKARFGLNNKVIWRAGREEGGIDALIPNVPDEYYPWFTSVVTSLELEARHIIDDAAKDSFTILRANFPDRKAQAEWVKREAKYPHLVFALLDGKIIDESVWKMIEPKELVWATPA